MPPKSARKSTAPPRKDTRRIVRTGEVNGEKLKLDEKSVSSMDADASTPEKTPVEVRSGSRKEAMNETNKEESSSSDKLNPTANEYLDDKKEEEKKVEMEEEEEQKGEQFILEEEYEQEEDSTAVDYEPEELPEHEVLMEEEIEVDEDAEGEEQELLEEELTEDDVREEELEEDNMSDPDDISGPEDDEEENDQKEHHEVVKEHRKRKEFEVFLGGLDKDATESDIRKAFTEAGELKEVRLLTNPITKKNKGFAFLRFATVEQARRVVSEFKNPMIRGRKCGIAPSHDNDTLFVGNICKTWTKEHLKETLKGFGVENFEDLKLVEDPHNEGMNRGFAFLEFSSRIEAMDALKCLQKRDVKLGSDRAPKVAFSDSFRELDEEIMSQVTTLFIDHLPPAWDEDKIRKYLKQYGSIEKIELARNMPGAKRRDFGFVTFDTHDNAIACVEGINDVELTDGNKKVKLRARLSRPTKKESRPRRSGSSMLLISPRARPMMSRMDRVRPALPRALPPLPRRLPLRPTRPMSVRAPLHAVPLPSSSSSRVVRRVVSSGRGRRPMVTVSERPRTRPLPPPPPPRPRPERLPPPPPLPPVRRPAYPKSSLKRERDRDRERDYSRHELPPPPPPPLRRERAPEYPNSRAPPSRRPSSYEDDYRAPPPSSYSDVAPRGSSRGGSDRRPYLDDDYRKHEERPVERGPSARGGRDYDSVYGNKRAYSDIDDAPRNSDVGRNTRSRLDYGPGSTGNHFGDSYNDRLGRGPAGYGTGAGSSRTSMSGGVYGRNQGLNYPGGSARGSDFGGMYSSGLAGEYMSRGSDTAGSSYPSFYPSRGLGGTGSGSYY
ncbi:RNA-binding (RRM/RBD/RNP motifs) family protein [Rhynchospora pubera]|uniref:RNA-binding (RRM/RBD/RNP motifs) family protein n=1 Tax=Rhynchospora pubera TaxID=906938 RepID=A0AAV8BN11_9POAL|nr:RNA-binding (RRM/RBD/RNP motifs) family protein [Rhynchospora pubera]KAJ4805788.1 RNA-binding (RRM/RBD/RNP motifs) family protein [Rhynchospora pubera]